ncbi:uncharacterized protein LOC113168805 isoform X2 [Anabas testudineus]|uniref:uncharacterized protein LOC113168805 isoform X2 n=1 Tax=Anabas testudineus TaxID=64144 RepID=UPI000E463CFB|nr:uncharacterized protein LOC113168805 isoform X2 [Anabas testudineus]
MIFILIITALATTAKGTFQRKRSIKCSFIETSAGQQCFSEVGKLLLFHLTNRTNTEMNLKKDNGLQIFKYNHQRVTLNDEYVEPQSKDQSETFTSGTLNLGKAKKRHSGNYTLEEFKSNGVLLKKVTVHLEIQAPVSQPAVSQVCLSPEEMKVSCSSEGDRVEFSLSLDSQLLMCLTPVNCTVNTPSPAEQDKSSLSDVTVYLNGQRTGNLKCKVWNKVSRHETVIHLTDCKDFIPSFPAVTVAVIAGVVLLLSVALILGITKLKNKPRPTTVNEIATGLRKTSLQLLHNIMTRETLW